MIWLLRPVVLAVLVVAVETNANAESSKHDAQEFAKKAAFAGKVVTCESRNSEIRNFTLSGDSQLTEINNPQYPVEPLGLTPADKLNGIDYEGMVTLAVDAYRIFDSKSHSWPEWEDPHSFNSILTVFADPGSSLLVGYTVLIQHKKGQWRILQNTLSGTAEFNCAKVDSIEAGTFKENKVQLPGEAPRPFEPNAVLNRRYSWTNDCTPAAGTRVMDLGVDKMLPDYKSVVMDPAVCPPKSHFATASIVPPDAIESIQEWNEHPTVPSSPAAQIAAPAQVSRPAPAASTVDPSRMSLSHNSTQTFYTTAAVPVYVHGLRGAILCIAPAHWPVPGRVQNRPPQFSGDFGVLAYKADLCPNAASSQPRDMYHEFFFRATGKQ